MNTLFNGLLFFWFLVFVFIVAGLIVNWKEVYDFFTKEWNELS